MHRFLRRIVNLPTLHRSKEAKQEIGPTIQMIREAIIQPRNQNYASDGSRVHNEGVFLPTGEPVSLAKHWQGQNYMNSPVYRDVPGWHREGSFVFGGWLFTPHFGHCVVESLGRLWATRYLSFDINSILFFHGFGFNNTVPDFFRDILSNLGIKGSIELVREPISVDRLFVPNQLFGVGRDFKANPEFLEFVHQLRHCSAALESQKDERRKIYVSRSRMGFEKGGILCERLLDEFFRRSGYEVFHPEIHTIEDQIRIYTGASTLVFSEGSAAHVFAFLARPDQRVAIIARRPNPTSFCRHISNFGGIDVVTLPFINYWVVPEKIANPTVHSLASVDFEAVAEALVKNSFIDSAAGWCNPEETEVHSEIRRMEGAVGGVRITSKLL